MDLEQMVEAALDDEKFKLLEKLTKEGKIEEVEALVPAFGRGKGRGKERGRGQGRGKAAAVKAAAVKAAPKPSAEPKVDHPTVKADIQKDGHAPGFRFDLSTNARCFHQGWWK